MNYYKLYPLEYKNSIFLVLALSLSPDKGMALGKGADTLMVGVARLHNWPRGGAWPWGQGGKCALKGISRAHVVLAAEGVGTLHGLPRAVHVYLRKSRSPCQHFI